MRHYQPADDGSEPTDFDVYYDIPAQTEKGIAARVYIEIERDPKRVELLDRRQGDAIMALLRWIHDHRPQLRAHGGELPEIEP